MMDAIFEAILEIVLMPIEPFIDWIDHIIDKKTKKYNKFLRNMIKSHCICSRYRYPLLLIYGCNVLISTKG